MRKAIKLKRMVGCFYMACWRSRSCSLCQMFPFQMLRELKRRPQVKAKFGVFLIDLLISQKEQKSFQAILTQFLTFTKLAHFWKLYGWAMREQSLVRQGKSFQLLRFSSNFSTRNLHETKMNWNQSCEKGNKRESID